MTFITSPNMSLTIPIVSSTPGPDYASDVNNSLTTVDQHDHSPGRGVQVTPAGLNINTDLSVQNNSLINLKSLVLTNQSAVSTNQALYVAFGSESPPIADLWFNDGAGNNVQLTSAGTVNATIASIPGESYSGGTFTWRQGTGSTTPANFDTGAATIRPNIAGTSFGVTLQAYSSIATSLVLTLPYAYPGAQSFMTMDSSGNITAPWTVDGTTIQVSDNQIGVASGFGVIPTGTVIPYAGSISASTPTGYLFCNGSAISRSTYSNLFTAIGTLYGVGDGSTTFNLPNLQAMFIRGTGTQTVSGQAYSASLALQVRDAFQGHGHEVTDPGHAHIIPIEGGSTTESILDVTAVSQPSSSHNTNTSTTGVTVGDPTTTDYGFPRLDIETRPISIGMNYLIKT